jgi:hypothetical protein
MQVGDGPTAVGVPVTQAAADDVLIRCESSTYHCYRSNDSHLVHLGAMKRQDSACKFADCEAYVQRHFAVWGHWPCRTATAPCSQTCRKASHKAALWLANIANGLVKKRKPWTLRHRYGSENIDRVCKTPRDSRGVRFYACRCYVVYEKLSGYRRVPSEYAAADIARAADAILKASRSVGRSGSTSPSGSSRERHV